MPHLTHKLLSYALISDDLRFADLIRFVSLKSDHIKGLNVAPYSSRMSFREATSTSLLRT